MKWLEIIEVRTTNRSIKELNQFLNELISEVSQELEVSKIRVYKSCTIEGDFSIHLGHHQSKPDEHRSVLGLRIADALKTYGMVNHQIWCGITKEEEPKNKLV